MKRFLLLPALALFLSLGACSSDDSSSNLNAEPATENSKSASGGSSSVKPSEDTPAERHLDPLAVDGPAAEFFAKHSIHPSSLRETLPSTDPCAESIEGALLEDSLALQDGFAVLETSCSLGDEQLSLSIEGKAVDVWKASDTTVVFRVPTNAVETLSVELSVGGSSTPIDVPIATAPAIADPQAYVDGFLAQLDAVPVDTEIGRLGKEMLAEAQAQVQNLSPDEVALLAQYIAALDDSLALEEKAFCTGENIGEKVNCYFKEVVKAVRKAVKAVASTVAACGMLALSLAPPSPLAAITAPLCLFKVAQLRIAVNEWVALNGEVMVSAVQAAVVDLLQLKATVESGIATQWSATGEYVSVQGVKTEGFATMSEYKEGAGDLVANLHSIFESAHLSFSGPGLDSTPVTETATPDSQYLTAAIKNSVAGVSLDSKATAEGLSLTFFNENDTPKIVTVDVTYHFPGVQKLTQEIDITVEPALVPRLTLEGGIVSDSVTGRQWQAQASAVAVTWSSHGCGAVTLGGFNDWRLPNADELSSLLLGAHGTGGEWSGDGCKIDALLEGPCDVYWTTDVPNVSTNRATVDFNSTVNWNAGIYGPHTPATSTAYVRCVR